MRAFFFLGGGGVGGPRGSWGLITGKYQNIAINVEVNFTETPPRQHQKKKNSLKTARITPKLHREDNDNLTNASRITLSLFLHYGYVLVVFEPK